MTTKDFADQLMKEINSNHFVDSEQTRCKKLIITAINSFKNNLSNKGSTESLIRDLGDVYSKIDLFEGHLGQLRYTNTKLVKLAEKASKLTPAQIKQKVLDAEFEKTCLQGDKDEYSCRNN